MTPSRKANITIGIVLSILVNRIKNIIGDKERKIEYPFRPRIYKIGNYARDSEPYMVGEYR